MFNGDITELDTLRRSTQIMTPNKSTILDITLETIEHLTGFVDASYFIKGTSAHTGKSSWSEEAIAGHIPNTVKTPEGKNSWWHYQGVASDVRVDIVHHANMGLSPKTRKNAANNKATDILLLMADRGEKPPDLAIRAHNHTYATSGDNYRCMVDYLPAWTLLTEFGFRLGLELHLADIGGIVYLCEDGEITKHKIIYHPPDEGKIWRATM